MIKQTLSANFEAKVPTQKCQKCKGEFFYAGLNCPLCDHKQ